MNFTSHSQAGQDLFVHAMLPKTDGTYIEIGGAHPIELSNTYALEQLGWRGVSVDIDENAAALHQQMRKNVAWCDDATKLDWEARLAQVRPAIGPRIDYASVDIDEWTHEALKSLLQYLKPAILTAEHDQYQRGDRLRLPNRELLRRHGYEIIAADVHSNGCCFEDWAVSPDLVDMATAEKFRSTGLDWADVLRKGGAL